MSSVSGVGSSLYQFLQSLSTNPQVQAASATTPAATTATTDAGAASGQQVQATGHHHHHGHGNGEMFKKIESAVTDALQQAQAGGSTTDPNKIIEDAIAKVLTDSQTTSPKSGTNPTSTGDAQTTGQVGQASDASRQAFFQMLKSAGVDPQQFRQDLLAAIKDAKGGQADPSTAFQSFPPGTFVDENA
jgi:hypothetical protein